MYPPISGAVAFSGVRYSSNWVVPNPIFQFACKYFHCAMLVFGLMVKVFFRLVDNELGRIDVLCVVLVCCCRGL